MSYLNNALDLTNIFFICTPIVLSVGIFAFKGILSPFLSKMAEDFAERLGARKKTQIIEEIRQKFSKEIKGIERETSLQLEEMRANSQLRVANADKRMKAHQEAYSLWLELVETVGMDPESSQKTMDKCLNWWKNNCIYLSQELNAAFYKTYWAVRNHSILLDMVGKYRECEKLERQEPDSKRKTRKYEFEKIEKEIEENFWRIQDLGNLIRESVQLPALSSKELSMLIKSVSISDQESEDQ